MHNRKVSVVITSFNQKEYLIQAIESVIRQTCRIYEIIVADDCSTDDSVDIIKDYQNNYPGLIKGVFNAVNQGIPRNRNAGLRCVTGDYVYILDGDDRFLPQNVEMMLSFLEKNPNYRCVYSNLNFIDSEGKLLYVRDKEEQLSGDLFFEIALGKFGILRNMIIDFSLLRDVGFFDEKFPRYDGFDLTVRLAKKCEIGYIFDCLAEYRVYPTSDSKGLKPRDHLEDLEKIYRKMTSPLKDLSKTQRKELRKAWSERLLRYYVQDYWENPRRIKRFLLPFVFIFKRFVKISDFIEAFKIFAEYS